jgi:hypothetical protein
VGVAPQGPEPEASRAVRSSSACRLRPCRAVCRPCTPRHGACLKKAQVKERYGDNPWQNWPAKTHSPDVWGGTAVSFFHVSFFEAETRPTP